MLTDLQRQQFDTTGVLRLAGAIPTQDADRMCARLWHFLESEHGIDRARPETWPTGGIHHLQAATRSGAFNPMASWPVCEALDDLLGARDPSPTRWWGIPLVTFVSTTHWAVPHVSWHLDGPAVAGLPGVTVFGYLAQVRPGGGGTVVVEGSHRLVDRWTQATGPQSAAKVKAGLAGQHPWLRELMTGAADADRRSRDLLTGVEIGGQRLCVRELTGEPGDVVLMHPRCLHAPAPNALAEPRMMLVEHVRRPWRAPVQVVTKQSAR